MLALEKRMMKETRTESRRAKRAFFAKKWLVLF